MSQNQQLFLLANVVSVNTAANTTSLNNSLVVGNSSVNVVINSSSVYVSGSPVGGATNTAAQYAWTNTQSFGAVVTHTANVAVNGAIIANGGAGTSGQVLTSSAGGNVYWSTAAGGSSNGASISVANLAITGSVTANGSVGTSGQALVSTGTGVQWGALSPGYNYSSQFNGSSNYLTVPSSSALAFGTGNFTIECWIYLLAVPSTNPPIVVVNGSNPFYFNFRGNGTLGITNATTVFATSTALLANAWYHIAAVRNSGSTVIYINGVAGTAVSCTDNFTQGSLNIGYATSSSFYLNAYISNLRILNGTALYTSNFTPPTSPLSAISGTSLLTCNAITPTSDSSTNNFQITNNGGVTTSAVQSPFTSTTVSIPTQSLTAVRQQFTGDGSTTSFAVAGGYTPNAISVFVNGVLLRNGTEVTVTNGSTVVFAIAPLSGALIDVIGTVPTTYSSITPVSYSVGFNGSTQYLSFPLVTATTLGSSDFTIEGWVYPNSSSTDTCIFAINSNNSTTYAGIRLGWQYNSGSPKIYLLVSLDGAGWVGLATLITASSVPLNTWTHIAVVRSGNNIYVYQNGVLVLTNSSASGSLYSGAVNLIGAYSPSGGFWPGYMSNVRLVKGLAVYTNNFTVPSSPLAITQSTSGAYIQAITGTQTSLLTCNGPTIIDGSTNAFTITNNGSAPVSTAIVPTFTNVTINNPSVPYYSVTSLVVGGGGGGGGYAGGGGGAGGFVAATSTLIVGSTYTVVVGGGGSAGVGNASTGVSGGLSLFNTSTALGGGGGGAKTVYALSGGSGGGGGPASSTPTGPGSGTNGQGFAGGVGFDGTTQFSTGGGGGGASAVGGNSGTSSASNTSGGAGGAGLASSITGSSVTYAGGGGGGTDAGSATMPGSGGAGGSGGGGTGGKYTVSAATAGTTNLGGGGGGAGWTTAGWNTGGAGGSGVVIISVPVANYTGTTTGSPTVTTNGNFKILTFTSSGTYTA